MIRSYCFWFGDPASINVKLVDSKPPTWLIHQLSITYITSNSMTLSWPTASSVGNLGVSSYQIFQNNKPIASVSGSTQSYVVKRLNPDTDYTFSIEAVDSYNGLSFALTNQAQTLPFWQTLAPHAVPENDTSIKIIWSADVSDGTVQKYDSFTNGQWIGSTTSPAFIAEHLKPNTSFSFNIVAVTSSGRLSDSPTSAQTSVDTIAPVWKSNELYASETTEITTQLNWNSAHDDDAMESYRLYEGSHLVATLSPNATTYKIRNLHPGTHYTYKMIAYDRSGNRSSIANQVSVTTLISTIKGTVIGAHKQPLSRSIVSLYNSKGHLVQTKKTTYRGYFLFKIPHGTYKIRIQHKGYSLRNITRKVAVHSTITFTQHLKVRR